MALARRMAKYLVKPRSDVEMNTAFGDEDVDMDEPDNVPEDNVVDDTQNNIKTLNTGLTSCGLQASRMKCNIQPCKLNLSQTEVLFLAEAPGGRQDLSFL